MAEDSDIKSDVPKRRPRGIFSRIWNGLFRRHGDDFEKKLRHISKEEAAIISRIRRRSQRWRGLARNLIVFSVFFEVAAVGYAIMTTRILKLDWKIRALRVFPMFILPALSSTIYVTLGSFIKMLDRKDQSNLERLEAERKENIDELKEINDYYRIQKIIQKYDTDPAAKAAAATVLASRLVADSGLKLYLDNVSDHNLSTGISNDVEFVNSSGLRQRKQTLTRSNSDGGNNNIIQQNDKDMSHEMGNTSLENNIYNNQVISEHHGSGLSTYDAGWFARFAAMLVGEDPMQCYALICGNCHMHNGLARKEDFPYVTYYCPHCNALNRSNNNYVEENSHSEQPNTSSSITTNNINPIENATIPLADSEIVQNMESIEASLETVDGSDVSISDDPKPDS